MHTYTALFDKQIDAESAQRELAKLGIVPVDGINLASKDSPAFKGSGAEGELTFWESVKAAFVPHEDRLVYDESVRQGGWLLTVSVDDASSQHVHRLLENSNAVMLNEREAEYRKAGLIPSAQAQASVPGIEPRLTYARRLEQGGIRVRSYIVDAPPDDEEKRR